MQSIDLSKPGERKKLIGAAVLEALEAHRQVDEEAPSQPVILGVKRHLTHDVHFGAGA